MGTYQRLNRLSGEATIHMNENLDEQVQIGDERGERKLWRCVLRPLFPSWLALDLQNCRRVHTEFALSWIAKSQLVIQFYQCKQGLMNDFLADQRDSTLSRVSSLFQVRLI